MSERVLNLSDQSFQSEVLESSVPVLVDFTATWCGPCKKIAPLVDQLADEYADQIKVAKVDVDQCRQTAQSFRVMAVPTLLMFKDGAVVGSLRGAVPKRKITALIDGAL